MRKVSGFTLIELLVVILILGILAATALPKFIDLSGSARTAAVTGFKGAIESASALNYGARLVTTTNGVAVQTCTAITNLLTGGLPTTVSVSGNIGASTSNGTVSTCSISYEVSGATATSAVSLIAVN